MQYMSIALIVLLVATSFTLQGCDLIDDAENWRDYLISHDVGNWEAKTNYLVAYAYSSPTSGGLNSCMDGSLPSTMVCNGRGTCNTWGSSGQKFCVCDTWWSDPECSTYRKSQRVAFFLSLFLGWTGADEFYLGFAFYGWLKLCSLGGLGIWWFYDFVRIGSGRVYTYDNFLVAHDLPRYVYVLVALLAMGVIGFGLSFYAIRKKRAIMLAELPLKMAQRKQFGPATYQGYSGTVNS